MSIFITGGTGFIGKKLVEKLSVGEEPLHLLVRPQSKIQDLENNCKIRLFYGDITDVNSILEGMKGCTKVFHLAACTRNWCLDEKLFYKVNLKGTINVFEAALRNRVQKIVLTSTCVTLGPSRDKILTEKDWRKKDHFYTQYEESKYLAELEAQKYLEEGLNLVTVNPTRVYGPGELSEANSVTRIIDRYIHARFPLILNKGNEIGNYALVDDVVKGHILAMEKGKSGEGYILGGENVSLKEFFLILNNILEDKHWQINIPPVLAKFFAWIEEKKGVYFKDYPIISRGWVETFLQNWAYSSEKAERELGYRHHTLKDGLKITCDWLWSLEKTLYCHSQNQTKHEKNSIREI